MAPVIVQPSVFWMRLKSPETSEPEMSEPVVELFPAMMELRMSNAPEMPPPEVVAVFEVIVQFVNVALDKL